MTTLETPLTKTISQNFDNIDGHWIEFYKKQINRLEEKINKSKSESMIKKYKREIKKHLKKVEEFIELKEQSKIENNKLFNELRLSGVNLITYTYTDDSLMNVTIKIKIPS